MAALVGFATANDFSSRWPSLVADPARTEALLEDAATWLRVWFPTIPEWPNGPVVDVLRLVSLQMVRRALRSEDYDGVHSMGEQAGPFSMNVRMSNPDGNLFLTSQEREGIENVLGARRPGGGATGVQLGGW